MAHNAAGCTCTRHARKSTCVHAPWVLGGGAAAACVIDRVVSPAIPDWLCWAGGIGFPFGLLTSCVLASKLYGANPSSDSDIDSDSEAAPYTTMNPVVTRQPSAITPLTKREIVRMINNSARRVSANDIEQMRNEATSSLTDNEDNEDVVLFQCPISHEDIADPVVLIIYGTDQKYFYERSCILDWATRGNTINPMTREEIMTGDVIRAATEEEVRKTIQAEAGDLETTMSSMSPPQRATPFSTSTAAAATRPFLSEVADPRAKV